MTWIAVGLVLAAGSGVAVLPFNLLFRPWKVRRLAYWLAARWSWYRSWMFRVVLRKMTRTVKDVSRLMVEHLVPAIEEATRKWAAFAGTMQE